MVTGGYEWLQVVTGGYGVVMGGCGWLRLIMDGYWLLLGEDEWLRMVLVGYVLLWGLGDLGLYQSGLAFFWCKNLTQI